MLGMRALSKESLSYKVAEQPVVSRGGSPHTYGCLSKSSEGFWASLSRGAENSGRKGRLFLTNRKILVMFLVLRGDSPPSLLTGFGPRIVVLDDSIGAGNQESQIDLEFCS